MNIYTIGYAQRSIDSFIATLKSKNINALADVRSLPYSRMFPDFNADIIISHLKSAGIAYVPMGDHLGPRSSDAEDYFDDGTVSFDRLRKKEVFLTGIERLKLGVDKGFNIAMMCAEKEHLTCHRNLLISNHLLENEGIDVNHILYDDSLELQTQSLVRLSKMHNLFPDMLRGQEECIVEAVKRQSNKCAYKKPIELSHSI